MEKRIMKFLQYKNLTASQFADILDVQRSGISHLFSGRNKPSLDLVLKMIHKFPEINIHWLLKGEGAMIADNMVQDSKDKTNHSETKLSMQAKLFSDTKPNEVENNSIEIKPIIKELQEEPNSRNIEEGKSLQPNLPKDRKIERIVMFYNDNTFQEYFPQ